MRKRLKPGWHGNTCAWLTVVASLCAVMIAAGSVQAANVVINQKPVAVALVNGLNQAVVEQQSYDGATLKLDGSQSTDPDNDPLTYSWDFDSNGTVDASGVQVRHTYPAGGPYTTTLKVTDPSAASSTATVTVRVQDTTPPSFVLTPVTAEQGQLIEGCGSASFSWLRYVGYKMGIAFRAPKSGTITNITLQWKCSSGYGAGRLGIYRFELHTNRSDNFAADTIIASATNITPSSAMGGKTDGAFTVPISAELFAGEIYHLVIANIDASPTRNWSSPNTLMTSIVPWDGTGCHCAYLYNGVWTPWSSVDNIFNTTKTNDINGTHCPLLLTWKNAGVSGDPYYSAAVSSGAFFFGATRAGEKIYWTGQPTRVTRIGVSVGKTGTPGTLNYHLEDETGVERAHGVIATAAQVATIPTWVYADVNPPVTLIPGHAYRLWFNSPDSPNANNCYFQSVPYGETTPAVWLTAGWGGTQSDYLYTDATGSPWKENPNADFTFSLQTETGGPLLDYQLEATSPAGAPAALAQPAVIDIADPNPVVAGDAPSQLALGTTTLITWIATDAAGNHATATQRVIVVDTTPPLIIAPPDITQQVASGGGITVNLGIPTVTDAGDAHPAVSNDAPAAFPMGITVVTWTATDASGNMATATQRVTIMPVPPPPPPITITSINPATMTSRSRNTTITYTLPVQATVQITMLNSAGAVVRQLLPPSTRAAGSYSITWDGTNASRRRVANGVYTVKVQGQSIDGITLTPALGAITVHM